MSQPLLVPRGAYLNDCPAGGDSLVQRAFLEAAVWTGRASSTTT